MWATEEVQERLLEHFGIEAGKGHSESSIGLNGGRLSRGVEGILALWDAMDIDGILEVRPPCTRKPRSSEGSVSFTEWGFGYKTSEYGSGAYEEQVVYPLAAIETVEEAEAWEWPDPDWYDYSELPSLIDRCGGRAVSCGYTALFTFHNYLRGLELSLIDPVLNPELTRYIVERLSDFFSEYHRRCFEAAGGRLDFTQVTDDWGSQNGLIASPDIFREFYKPAMQRGINLAKDFDIRVFHHNDGDMRPLLPELVDMGIDILNPIQWRCGDWNLKDLKDRFGNRVSFHSAVDNQETLPSGTADDVRKQVRELLETLGSDGTGFILGPCHNLQPNTATENILALYSAARDSGSVAGG
jgi:uroporphyrinogen decarboxylase